MKILASRLPRPALPSGWMPIVSDRVVWALLVGILLVGLMDPDQVPPSLAFIRKALMGMSPGAGLAFMTAGAVSSIPAALAVFALVRRSVFGLYIFLGFTGSVIAGLLDTLFV